MEHSISTVAATNESFAIEKEREFEIHFIVFPTCIRFCHGRLINPQPQRQPLVHSHTHTYSLVSMSELRAFYKTKSLMFHVCNRSCKWSFGILAPDDCFSNVVTHSSLPVRTSDLHVV